MRSTKVKFIISLISWVEVNSIEYELIKDKMLGENPFCYKVRKMMIFGIISVLPFEKNQDAP